MAGFDEIENYWRSYFAEGTWHETPNNQDPIPDAIDMPGWSPEVLVEFNEKAKSEIYEGTMVYCEAYHDAMVSEAIFDPELELFIFTILCPQCDTENKEVIGL